MNRSMRLPSPVAAVVFDCDGLLLDTEHLWDLALREIFTRRGRTMTDDERAAVYGVDLLGTIDVLAETLGERGEEESLRAELASRARELLTAKPQLRPGAREALAAAARVPSAIASNTERQLLEGMLHAAGIINAVDHVVSASDVDQGKPAPDVYLRACELTGAEPGQTLAFEDSPTGATAASAAGLFVIYVPSSAAPFEAAHMTAPSLLSAEVRNLLKELA